MKVLLLLTVVGAQLLSAASRVDEPKDWWQTTVFYQIYPRSFQDSDGDGIGDLKGVTSRLEHLKDAGVSAAWLNPIFKSPMADFGYDISDYEAIQPEYGTMEDFEELIAKANKLGIKIILDYVPNHSSDQHEWFIKSEAKDPEFDEYYVWRDGKPNPEGGQPLPPNNWVSVFYGPAWSWSESRQQYYYHQFTKNQPDLNYRHPPVATRMKDVLRFWMAKGVSGFRCDAVNHMLEVEDLRDEPENHLDPDPLSYYHFHHNFTRDLPEVYDIIYSWRDVLDDWKKTHGGDTRIMMTEAYANMSTTMRYYQSEDGSRKGAHIPFNFLLIAGLNIESTASDFVHIINKWMSYMLPGFTPNWVLGNHDNPRVGSRFGPERIDSLNALLLTLPGAGVTFNGEEFGMLDYKDISWEETKDPAACNLNPTLYKNFTRDPVRTPLQWDTTQNAGFSSASETWLPVNPNYVDLNLKAQKAARKSHFKFYQRLMKLRELDTFVYGDLKVQAFSRNVFAYVRALLNNDTYVVVINLGSHDEQIDLRAFVTLGGKFKVVAASPMSSYAEGVVINSHRLTIEKFDVVVLIEAVDTDRSSGTMTNVNVLFKLAGLE